MRKSAFIVMTLLLAPALFLTSGPSCPASQDAAFEQETSPVVGGDRDAEDIIQSLAGLSCYFLRNEGQMGNPDVLYYSMGDPLSVGFSKDGIIFNLKGKDLQKTVTGLRDPDVEAPMASFMMKFDDNRDTIPRGIKRIRHPTHFLHGSDPSSWIRGVSSYEEIVYDSVYDEVDARFYFKDGMLKYDIVLGPGVPIGRVSLSYEGIEGLRIDQSSGNLVITTAYGELHDTRPVFFPTEDRISEGLQGSYRLIDETSYSFKAPEGLPNEGGLVIDPGIEFSTLFGSSGGDLGTDLELDDDGSIFVLGHTNSSDIQATPGVYDEVIAGSSEGFLFKLDAKGSDIGFFTYIGGDGVDMPKSLEITPSDTILIWGETKSTDIYTTSNAMHEGPIGDGTVTDCFLVELSDDGTMLEYGTYFGGSNNDLAHGMVVSKDGSVYLSGASVSKDINKTHGDYCMTIGGMWDSFVLKLLPDRSMGFCRVVGGNRADWLDAVILNGSGDLVIAGTTNSTDLPYSGNAIQKNNNGFTDLFLAVLNSTDSRISALTYFGGNSYDSFGSAVIGANGTIHVGGTTSSPNLPIVDPIQENRHAQDDGFIATFTSDLSDHLFCTYMGDEASDKLINICFNDKENLLYFSLWTRSDALPTEKGSFDPIQRGENDVYLAEIDMGVSGRKNITYSTYIGGSGEDFTSRGMVCDPQGKVLLIGKTSSVDFYTTRDAYCRKAKGDKDAFILRIDPRYVERGPEAPILKRINGTGNVTIEWEHDLRGSRVLDFEIQRWNESRRFWDLTKNVTNVSMCNWTDESAENGTYYKYRIRARSSFGFGNWSSEVLARPLGPPSMPVFRGISTGNWSIRLEWEEPELDGGEILGYHVHRSKDGVNYVPWGNTTGRTITSYNDTKEITIGDRYYYRIWANNSRFDSTQPLQMDIIALGPPKGLDTDDGNGTVTLTWEIPQGNGEFIGGFRIYRRDGTSDWTLVKAIQRHVNQYKDDDHGNGLENGETYEYYITTYFDRWESDASRPETARPFGPPGPPRDVTAKRMNRTVRLEWHPPEDNNGRNVTGYRIYYGESAMSLDRTQDVGEFTTWDVPGINGTTYYFRVKAINEAGEGNESDLVNATPIGEPGPIIVNEPQMDNEGVHLDWEPPRYDGGRGNLSLTYYINRSVEDGPSVFLESVSSPGHLDDDVIKGTEYTYTIWVNNTVVDGPSRVLTYTYLTVPGPVTNFPQPKIGVIFVNLSWDEPLDPGGVSIDGYHIKRGLSEDTMTVIGFTEHLMFIDSNVSAGEDYWYTVVPENSVGLGEEATPKLVRPLNLPGPPRSFSYDIRDGKVILSWKHPSTENSADVTGYILYRGPSREGAVEMVRLGVVRSYTDENVEEGKTYYYIIQADSSLGLGGEAERPDVRVSPDGWSTASLALLALSIVMATSLAYVVGRRYRARRPEEEAPAEVAEEVEVEVPAEGAGAVAAEPAREAPVPEPTVPVATAGAAAERAVTHIVERVLVVYKDGRLVTECAREECRTRDADLMSGMLIAVQGLIQDGLEKTGELRSIRYGENIIEMASGSHVVLAAVVYGEPDEDLSEELIRMVSAIEASFAGVIEEWTGDLKTLAGIEERINPLLEGTAAFTREDVRQATEERGVHVLSAVDFYRGYVRLKMAAVNATDHPIMDCAVEVHYDTDMLRLERVEPDTIKIRGDRTALGNILPGERKTVAVLFDPQICQATHLDGHMSYYDTRGELQYVDMKRRHAEVVCPVFFTKENANTAMLKRLMDETLWLNDSRVYKYPWQLESPEVLRIGKEALGEEGVQLVREFIVEAPQYEAEVWYYAETKVKGYQFVIRLRVLEERRVIELFAASTSMKPITGLHAEFRRELNRIFHEKYAQKEPLVDEQEEEIRQALRSKPLYLDTVEDEDVHVVQPPEAM